MNANLVSKQDKAPSFPSVQITYRKHIIAVSVARKCPHSPPLELEVPILVGTTKPTILVN
jgi:hypothetical protein